MRDGAFYLGSRTTGDPMFGRDFATIGEARDQLAALPEALAALYEVRFNGDSRVERLLTEGLRKDDLQHILLPRVSVDEYVSKDPDSDNVVVAFFIKHVPEAVEPLRTYCDKCDGVMMTDAGDSDTIANASIVYTEFSRTDELVKPIASMISQVATLAGLKPSDMSLSFPHVEKKYPFSKDVLTLYFRVVRDSGDDAEEQVES